MLGTSGVVFAVLPAYAVERTGSAHVFCHAAPGTWHAMGVMLSAAGSLSWLHAVVGGDYQELDAEAAEWPPGVEGLQFAPYLAGERTPHADPDARGAFIGLSLRHNRGALVRATLEGVAYGLRDCLELLRELGVEPGRSSGVSGGGSRSSALASDRRLRPSRPRSETTEGDEGSRLRGGAARRRADPGVYANVEEAVAVPACASATSGPSPMQTGRTGTDAVGTRATRELLPGAPLAAHPRRFARRLDGFPSAD